MFCILSPCACDAAASKAIIVFVPHQTYAFNNKLNLTWLEIEDSVQRVNASEFSAGLELYGS